MKMYEHKLPPALIQHLQNVHGELAEQWLNELPKLLDEYAHKWQLTLGACYADASFNFVAPALLNNGEKVVLKCGIPHEAMQHEIAALQYFNGIGAARLLQAEQDKGIFLLEQVTPGTLLETHADENKTTVLAVKLMNQLHKPLAEKLAFPNLQDWFNGFDKLYAQFNGKTGPFPKILVDSAKGISHELLSSMSDPVLLHGDLHYANILFSDRHGALAIDPKGVMGEREYEIPFPRIDKGITKKFFKRRIDCFIDISEFDRQRVIGWFFSKAMLAAWWSFEDNGEICQSFLDCAEIVLEVGV